MDLKTYAVKQALDGNPDLLKAISQNKPIDLDVANKSFAPLIADQDAGDTQNLIDNYPDYLVRHTKMQINSGKQDDDLEISGEVDDNLLDVIELLHHVQPGDVIKQAASRLMAKFAPAKAVDVADITFAKSAAPESKQEDVVANEAPESKQENVVANEADEAPAEMPEAEASAEMPEAETPAEMPEAEASAEMPEVEAPVDAPEAGLPDYAPDDEVPDFDENDFDSLVNQAPEDADADEDADEADEDAEIDHDLGDIEAGMNSKIIPLKPTLEKPDQAEVESAQKLKLAHAFKDAMHFLKDKIQEKQLDQKLDGLHMNALDV